MASIGFDEGIGKLTANSVLGNAVQTALGGAQAAGNVLPDTWNGSKTTQPIQAGTSASSEAAANTGTTYDPYSQTAPQVNSGLLAGAMNPAPQVTATTTTDKVAQGTTSNATASNAAATNAQATLAGTQQAAGTNWNVEGNQTVAGQVNGIIAGESPLMQRAVTRANQDSNARGLQNSSMAVTAGQAALYDAALPIAQQDAQTYASAGKYNADVANNTSQFNAAQANDVSKFNAGTATDVSRFNAGNATDVSKLNASNATDVSKQNAAQANAMTAQNMQAKNDALKADASMGLQAQLANQDAAVKQSAQQYDGVLKSLLANADAQSKLQLQQIDGSVRTSLADIEAKYKVQMQTSQSMASTYQSMIDGITRVMADKDLDATAKQNAINVLTQQVNNVMGMQSQITGLNLGSLLVAPSAGSPAPAPAPAVSRGGWQGAYGDNV